MRRIHTGRKINFRSTYETLALVPIHDNRVSNEEHAAEEAKRQAWHTSHLHHSPVPPLLHCSLIPGSMISYSARHRVQSQ